MQVILERGEADDTPWGFRLHGGIDKGKPVSIYRITAKSLAEKSDLQVGDILESVNGQSTQGLSLRAVQDRIKEAEKQLELIITRNQKKLDKMDNNQQDESALSMSETASTSSFDSNSFETAPVPPAATFMRHYERHNSNPLPSAYNHSNLEMQISKRRSAFLLHNGISNPISNGNNSRLRAATLHPGECSFAKGRSAQSPALERIRRQCEGPSPLAIETQQNVQTESAGIDERRTLVEEHQPYRAISPTKQVNLGAVETHANEGYNRQASIYCTIPHSFSANGYANGYGLATNLQSKIPQMTHSGSHPLSINATIIEDVASAYSAAESDSDFDQHGVSSLGSKIREINLSGLSRHCEIEENDKKFENRLDSPAKSPPQVEDEADGNFGSRNNYRSEQHEEVSEYGRCSPNKSIGNNSLRSGFYMGTRQPSKSCQSLHSIMKVPRADISFDRFGVGTDCRQLQRESKRVAINPHVQVLTTDDYWADESEDSSSRFSSPASQYGY